jgi:hypothetical protein
MTLVAAYRPQGVPVLLGDFLITGGEAELSRKKICLVGPNFVIGWTGRQFLAAPILKALFEEFGGKSVTMSEIEKFLTNRPNEELLTKRQMEEFSREIPLYLIGWVIDDHPHCFRWNITWPTELFYEPFQVAGSGEAKFRELITRETLGGSWGARRTNVDQAIYSALSKATELYSDEVLERMNRRQGFGYAYELLYLDGNAFRYLDNVAYLGMDIILNPADWTGRSQPYEVWYRYHSLGDISFLQVTNLRNGDMRLETIHPAFDQKPRDASFEFTAGSFRADYYCIYLRLQTTEGDFYQGSLVLAENQEGPSLYEKQVNGTYRFELSRDLVKFIYENMKAEREHRKENTIRWGWGAAETVQRISKAGTRIQFQVGQTDKCAVMGLMADREWDQNYNTIDYAIMCCPDATLQIYEKGVAVGPFGKTYSVEDTFGIGLEESGSVDVIRYYLNDELLYTSETKPILPLKGAASMREEGATIKQCQITYQ